MEEIAEKIVIENGIYDVQVTSVSGFLSDHYDPTKRTVNLSEEVYEGTNVSAAAVAAHNVVMRFNMLQITQCSL